jgi:hypothetical protein
MTDMFWKREREGILEELVKDPRNAEMPKWRQHPDE